MMTFKYIFVENNSIVEGRQLNRRLRLLGRNPDEDIVPVFGAGTRSSNAAVPV
jgi:hypothetical protein